MASSPSPVWEATPTDAGREHPRLSVPAASTGDGDDGQDGSARLSKLEGEVRNLRDEVTRSRLILESAIDYAIITMDTGGCITSWNSGAQQILGYAGSEILGRSGEIIFTSDDRSEGRFTVELYRAVEHGRAVNDRWHLRRDGTRFWASGMMTVLLDAEGNPDGFLNILRDRTEAHTEMERRELRMAEMNHRTKNILSTVQAVASQTGRHAATMPDFLATFGARLTALARSHETLIRGGWKDAPLREVVEGALIAYGEEPDRITIEGAAVMLAANLVVSVSLAFHELATNAVKHGSLSVPNGRVNVSWKIASMRRAGQRVEILWRERGGPPVQTPERRGFGFQLLERGMHSSGTIQTDFCPEGLECRVSLPVGPGKP